MYDRLDDVTCIGNLISSVLLNFMKFEKVVPIYEFKFLCEHTSLSLFTLLCCF